jgi:hypothetical protein
MRAASLMRARRYVFAGTKEFAGKKGAAGMKPADSEVIGASTRKTVSALYSEYGAYIMRVASDASPKTADDT